MFEEQETIHNKADKDEYKWLLTDRNQVKNQWSIKRITPLITPYEIYPSLLEIKKHTCNMLYLEGLQHLDASHQGRRNIDIWRRTHRLEFLPVTSGNGSHTR